jgi:hypothetical protein
MGDTVTFDADRLRLDRLSDPTFQFNYSIRADGEVLVEKPNSAVCKDLRGAIDYARAFVKEIPFCPVCPRGHSPVTEEHSTVDGMAKRWECPVCKTSFIH